MSQRLKFRPRPALLLLWAIWIAVGATLIGGGVAFVCISFGYDGRIGLLAGAGLGAVLGTLALVYYSSMRYWIDDVCLTRFSGVLWRTRHVVPLQQITHLTVRRSPLGRIFRYGSIHVYTPSAPDGAPAEQLVGIHNPHQVRRALLTRIRALSSGGNPSSEGETDLRLTREVLDQLRDIHNTIRRIDQRLAPKDAPLPVTPKPPPTPDDN